MAREHINFGTAPMDERCAQLGTDGYDTIARAECRRHIALLRDVYIAEHGALPEGLTLRTKTFNHDYGFYYEVVAEFDVSDAEASEAALWLDNNRPTSWPA